MPPVTGTGGSQETGGPGSRRRLSRGTVATAAVFAALVALLIVSGIAAVHHAAGGSGSGLTGPTLTGPLVSNPAPTTTQTSTAPTTPTTPTTLAAPTTTTIPAADLVNRPIGPTGTILVPPPSPDRRNEDAPNDCFSLGDPGYQNVDCRSTGTAAGSLTYLIEFEAASATAISSRSYVFRQNPDGSEQVVLEALDDAGTRFVAGEIDAHVTTVASAGVQEVVFGFHELGPNYPFAIDIVEEPGVVVVHQDLLQGVATVGPGRLDTWAGPPTSSTSDVWTHDVIERVTAGWRVVEEEHVPGETVPQTGFA